MEYYHIFTIKESVETDISRALNISVTMAVQDMDWVQHNSVMDTQKAQREFKTYLTEDMKLNDEYELSLIHISEPTRQAEISYAVFCLKKKNKEQKKNKK